MWIGYKSSTRCGRVHFEHSHRKWLVITVRPTTSVRESPQKNLPPRNTSDLFCRRFTRQNHRCAAWAVFFFSGNFSGQGPSILLSCCARLSRCLKAPLGLSLLRCACKRKPYLENFMSRPNVISAFQSTPLHQTGAGTSFGSTGDYAYEQ